MVKTILVPATGGEADLPVFEAALAVARPFGAHLDFLHVRPDPMGTMAAMGSVHGFGVPPPGELLDRLEREAAAREREAQAAVRAFCESSPVALRDLPAGADEEGVTAQWHRETGRDAGWLVAYGRAADLLVIGRPSDADGVARDALEAALLDTGRPLLIPGRAAVRVPLQTAVIAWKPAACAARAVAAATPFLERAKRVVVMTAAEGGPADDDGLLRLMAGLGWHGIDVTARPVPVEDGGDAAEALFAAAAAAGAGLVVMGGYGHGRLRELVFGGFTERALRDRDTELPVLMAH